MSRTYRKNPNYLNVTNKAHLKVVLEKEEADTLSWFLSWGYPRGEMVELAEVEKHNNKIIVNLFNTQKDSCSRNKGFKQRCKEQVRAAVRNELSKSYRDWDHDFDRTMDLIVKKLLWVYF